MLANARATGEVTEDGELFRPKLWGLEQPAHEL